MKLPRPYIPLRTRCLVAGLQIIRKYPAATLPLTDENLPLRLQLDNLLFQLFHGAPAHLDHDPPLCNRELLQVDVRGEVITRYTPDANDTDYLIYRKVEDHKTKTFVRGDGALRSDMAQRRYLKRVAANRKPKKAFKPRRAKHIRRLPHASIPVRSD